VDGRLSRTIRRHTDILPSRIVFLLNIQHGKQISVQYAFSSTNIEQVRKSEIRLYSYWVFIRPVHKDGAIHNVTFNRTTVVRRHGEMVNIAMKQRRRIFRQTSAFFLLSCKTCTHKTFRYFEKSNVEYRFVDLEKRMSEWWHVKSAFSFFFYSSSTLTFKIIYIYIWHVIQSSNR